MLAGFFYNTGSDVMKDFFKSFFGSPVMPTLTAILTILAVAFIYAPEPESKMTDVRLKALQSETQSPPPAENNSPVVTAETDKQSTGLTPVIDDIKNIPVTTAKIVVYSITEATEVPITQTTQTALSAVSSAETTTVTTCEPHEYYYDYISAGESPNSSYYQDRLAIIGDSIAYGFNAYGYIPYEHNIAKESLAVWNMDSYFFDIDGYYAGVLDTADYVNTPLYFISMGINDIYGCSPDEYGTSMLSIAQQLLERVPTATIVVGAITPIADWNGYTTNETIRSFNHSLQNAVESAGNSQILFFDTYSVLADPYTLALSDDHSGGDGMHLSSYSYSYILNCLFNFLDSADVTEQIQVHDTTGY